MADNVEFKDYSIEVKEKINDALIAALIEASGEIVSQTARNSRVDTEQTKGSFEYVVDEEKLESTVGSPFEPPLVAPTIDSLKFQEPFPPLAPAVYFNPL